MKSPSLGKFQKLKNDKYYSIDPKIGSTLEKFFENTISPNHKYTYIEPCCGNASLIDQLSGDCIQAIDIQPEIPQNHKSFSITEKGDARSTKLKSAKYIITNPPFSKSFKKDLHEMLKVFINSNVEKTFLLLPFNWATNVDFQWAMKHCSDVIPTGRLKWIPGTKQSDTKDHAWYVFQKKPCDTIMRERYV